MAEERSAPLAREAVAMAGALVVLAGFPLFRLWSLIWSQVSAPRALGVMAVLAVVLLAAGTLLALVGRLPPFRAPWLRRAASTAFWAVAVSQLGLIGIQLFHPSIFAAPPGLRLALVVVVVGLTLVFHRHGEAERGMLLRGAVCAGVMALALPLAATPWVAWAAATDRVRLEGAPEPLPASAVRPDAPKRIVVVTCDALRLQSTSLFEPRLDTTPHLAALAAEGTAYMNARAVSDMTAIAMPSLAAGVRPGVMFRQNEGRSYGAMVRTGFMTSLGGHLRPAGYATMASTMAVSPKTMGFDGEYDEVFTTLPLFAPNTFNVSEFLPLGPAWDWAAARLTRRSDQADPRLSNNLYATREAYARALAFLRSHPKAFVWIHVAVPHLPMVDVPPPGVLEDTFQVRRFPWMSEEYLLKAKPEEMPRYVKMYENYTRFGDAELGRFFAGLRAAGLYDDAMIVVSADHGENLVAHEHPTHAVGLLTERITRVPLVVRPPGGGPPRRDDRLASGVDLVPTVLDRVYDRLPAGLSGVSLARPADPDRPVYTWALTARYFPKTLPHAGFAAYWRNWRYMRHYEQADAPAPRETLVDLASDPAAEHDMSAQRADLLAQLRAWSARDNALGP